jgi:hypothetical protein
MPDGKSRLSPPEYFLSRRVVLTTLDPVPRNFRACPGMIVLSLAEAAALRSGDGATFKALAAIVSAEDAWETRRVG